MADKSEQEKIDAGRIEAVDIQEELEDCYLAYAMSVIIGRALPDVRDGLKPVHRRILYAMYKLDNVYNKPHKKSARVVGDVIGKYHPHGDSAVYDALVRLAQPFTMQHPLADGQGNFGSVDGDPPAAMRYTEVRLAKIANEVLADIDKDTVDFVPNYDDTEEEPSVLPTKFPMLLVNGSNGIAVGMATNIPPHNLSEIIDGLIYLMRHPSASLNDMLKIIKGPDFPTCGIICGRRGIVDAYATGIGRIMVRARVEEEKVRNHEALVVTELPYQVNKEKLVEDIKELVREKRIDGIAAIRDESSRKGIRVVIEVKKDAMPQLVLNQLFDKTSLQSTFAVNMLSIVNGTPLVLGLIDILRYFIEFRRDVTVRRTIFLLRKAKARAHILEGLKIALDHIDAVIALIRSSATTQEAKIGLITQFGLSDLQAQAILDMRLQRLTGLERDKILADLDAVLKEISEYERILKSREAIDQLIIDDFEQVKANYGIPRRTEIIGEEITIDTADLISDDAMIVTRTNQNWIKRVPLTEYRAQKRGGRGKNGMDTKESDFVRDVITATAHQRLLVFTSHGRAFQIRVFDIPEGSRNSKGKPIVNMLPKLEKDENIESVLPIPADIGDAFLILATEMGNILKVDLGLFSKINKSGLRAIKIRENDRLIAARIVKPGEAILMATNVGKSILFMEDAIRTCGRGGQGVRGIRCGEGQRVIDMCVLEGKDKMLLTVTSNGFGKRSAISEYRVQARGGKGITAIKTSARNGELVALMQVNEEDHLIIVTDNGTIIRTRVSEIRVSGRATQGVRLMKAGTDEHIVAVAPIVDPDDDVDDSELQSLPQMTDEEAAELAAEENADESDDEEDSPESEESDE